MPAFLKIAMKFVVLSALVFGVVAMKPAKANAFSCESDCNVQLCNCLSGCGFYDGFIKTRDFECETLCQDQSWTCLACCSDPTTCV